ncbi:BA14K family protein [Rhizobium sp. BK251]|uniref:BA14K family protein n=1 Tax=Rhizobium sp. BK251 TaxID=2512125 RepID=UPI001053FFA1|nr:BA14K family protein [Rhizobium sp. BK251]TCL75883.1 BA14K-like protein [Rhizobium sp. BK251]
MSRLSMRIATAAVSAAVLLSSFVQGQAMPLPQAPAVPQAVPAATDVQNVQFQYERRSPGRYYGGFGGYGGYGGYRGYRPYYGGYRPYYGGGYRPYRYGYYNGYRGYPYYRSGYRYYNNYWFPLAAFGAGAIIGGAIASQPRYYAAPAGGINPRHVYWCESRYRSYRSYDNTFQPYYGPRQQCYSPYF